MSEHAKGELLLHIVRVNTDRGLRFYDEREPVAGSVFEDVEEDKLPGELYRRGVAEYGRCVGKVYVDTTLRGTVQVGYVFVKRERYDDVDESYLCETWIAVERVLEPARPNLVESVALCPAS